MRHHHHRTTAILAQQRPCRVGQHQPLRAWWRTLGLAAALTMCGCATYAPLPLGHTFGAATVSALTAPLTNMPLPALATHRFDPTDGLDVTEVAMLAVANNPALKVARDDLGVARAQAFAAGLLPDPQLSVGADFPQPKTTGLTTAFNLGVSEDVTALLTRSSRMAVARSQADQVNLDLLWAEWQTVAQARLLFDQVTTLRAQRRQLDAEHAALASVDRYVQMALHAGNLTYDTASAGLNAGADVRKRSAGSAIALHQAESDLRSLLGLAPTAALDLLGAAYQAAPTAVQVQAALSSLPQRRPDLLALQAGYESQEEKLRGAVLAQFPALSLGFTRARDTGNINTNGFTIGITLPLFNRNRGNIAVEKATRQRLRDDYAARMVTTRADMSRLMADLTTLDAQRVALAAHTQQLDAARHAAEQAWQQDLLDWPTYLAIRSNALSADMDLISVQQEQAKQSIALEALLGSTDLVVGSTHASPTQSAQTPTP